MNIPLLRFSEFASAGSAQGAGEWVEKNYGDIYSFYTTNSFSRDNLNYEKGIVKNIHYGDIHTKFSTMFKLEKEKVPFINEDIELNKIKDESYCQVGDLVVADASEDYADIGKTMEIMSLNNEKTLAGLHTFLARPNKYDMALGYTGYLLQSWKVRKQIMRIAQGTKVLSLSTKRLADVILHIPSKPEQQKIATFLSAVDSSIEQLTKKEKLLRAYKKGVMQKIFSREIRFRDDDDGVFPEWVEKRLGEVVKIYDGTHQTPKYVDNGIPFYSVEHLTANQFEKTKYITPEVFEKENKRVELKKGDILMTRIGSIGVAKYIDWDIKGSFYVSLALIKRGDICNNGFLTQYINSTYFQRELWKRTIHVAFPKKINLGEIGMCKVSIPKKEEQTKIANFLSSLDEKITQTHEALEAKKHFKKGLLQKMFV